MTGAEVVRVLAPRRDRNPLIVIQCERFACKLSRLACGIRSAAAQDPFARYGVQGCRGCPIGESNAALVKLPVRRRDHRASYRAINRPSLRGTLAPFYEARR